MIYLTSFYATLFCVWELQSQAALFLSSFPLELQVIHACRGNHLLQCPETGGARPSLIYSNFITVQLH